MSCTGCKKKKNKSHSLCTSSTCDKLYTFDWLNIDQYQPKEIHTWVEVRFKNGRKEIFNNDKNLDITLGDAVITTAQDGYHLGYVALKGPLVNLQITKKNIKKKYIKPLIRIATENDISKYNTIVEKEKDMILQSKEIINNLGLEMKLTDVEYQADLSKATFFYSAQNRVDFRELVRKLVEKYKIRIEMKQINLRVEAGRMGGIGSCGRELCCSTWLTQFKNVPSSSARYQNLSLNQNKLSGQCGRLKCCLNYELDTYKELLKDIPKLSKPLVTKIGEAKLQKTDIFKKIMWFSFPNDNLSIPVKTKRVLEIIQLNKDNILPDSLLENKSTKESLKNTLNSDLDKKIKDYHKNQNKKVRHNKFYRKKRK